MGARVKLATAVGGAALALAAVVASAQVPQGLHDTADVTVATLLAPERVTFVDRPRVDAATRNPQPRSTVSSGRNSPAAESSSLMMLLAVVALVGYVIGRRGNVRG